jgi:HTH-type transcriptional regulator / antitoxin HigA
MSSLHPSYLKLLRQLPLRPIRTEREFDLAVNAMNRLAVFDEGSLDVGQQDYFDTLCVLVDAYDKEHHRVDTSGATAQAVLRELMTNRNMTVSNLAAVVGSQPLASMILSGKREISRRVALKLAGYFKLEPGVFLNNRPTKRRAS